MFYLCVVSVVAHSYIISEIKRKGTIADIIFLEDLNYEIQISRHNVLVITDLKNRSSKSRKNLWDPSAPWLKFAETQEIRF